PLNIGKAARQDATLNRQAFDRDDDLHAQTIKVAPLACAIPTKFFVLSEPTARDADVVADRNRERIQRVAALKVQLFDDKPQLVKEQSDEVGEPRQTARESRAREHARHHPGRVEEA